MATDATGRASHLPETAPATDRPARLRFSATHGLVVAALLLGACSAIADPADPAAAPPPGTTAQGPGSPDGTTTAPAGAETPGIETIDHFIFLVQENRSFDHYFGTYPGANGIP